MKERSHILTRRGKPPGQYRSYKELRLLEYLVETCVKHKISPDEFFKSFREASEVGKSECGDLSISRRLKERQNVTFLIAKGGTVVAQLPLPKSILQKDDPLKEFEYNTIVKEDKPNLKIKDLRAGMRSVELRAKVLDVSKRRLVATSFGSCIYMANALVADETGTILLSLWGKQIDETPKGSDIQIGNAKAVRFQGRLQLRIGRDGTLTVLNKTN